MSRTNIDFLFQVPAPVGDRSCFNMPRIDEYQQGFGDHLNQASAPTLDTATSTGGSGDQPATSDSASSDYESPSSETSPRETAGAHEAVVDDREDCGGDEPRDAEVVETAQDTVSGNTPVSATKEETDSEHDSDDEDVPSDTAIIVVAETVHTNQVVIAAAAELSESTISEDAIVKVESPKNTAQDDPAIGDAEAKHAKTTSPATETKQDDATVSTLDMLKSPTTPGEPVDETLPPKPVTELRPAKPEPTTETKRQNKDEARLNHQVDAPPQNLDAPSLGVAEEAEAQAPRNEPKASEPVPSERAAITGESRDASAESTSRQRSDAAALVTKVLAAVANGQAPQPVNNTPQRDEADKSAREIKASATKNDVAGTGTPLHANAASTKRGQRASGTDEMPHVDPARFVGRVAKAFHTAQERGGTLQIRLSPPELGAMRLELAVTDGVMTASLETESASARRVLLEHLPALRERLAEQNIRVERFDVDVRREGAASQHDPRAAQDGQQPQQGHPEQRRRQPAPPPVAETARQIKPINTSKTNNHGINLVA